MCSSPKNRINAGVSLTTVIILSGILLLSGITILLKTIDLANAAKLTNDSFVARINTRTCLEEAVQKMKYNVDYIGSFSVDINSGTCTVTVSNDSVLQNVKVIDIESTLAEIDYTSQVKMDVSDYPFAVIK